MLTTSFNLLKKAGACANRYHHLATALGGITKYGNHTPITIEQILDINGLSDALWALRAVAKEQTAEGDTLARLFACNCAQDVLPIYEHQVPGDARPRNAINAARAFALGTGSMKELTAAEAAAGAAGTAWAAWAAARAAAEAAAGAAGAAWAARAAARAAAWAVAGAAWAARAAAWAAAEAAAGAAAEAAAGAAWAARAAWAAAEAAAEKNQAERLRTALRGEKIG